MRDEVYVLDVVFYRPVYISIVDHQINRNLLDLSLLGFEILCFSSKPNLMPIQPKSQFNYSGKAAT